MCFRHILTMSHQPSTVSLLSDSEDSDDCQIIPAEVAHFREEVDELARDMLRVTSRCLGIRLNEINLLGNMETQIFRTFRKQILLLIYRQIHGAESARFQISCMHEPQQDPRLRIPVQIREVFKCIDHSINAMFDGSNVGLMRGCMVMEQGLEAEKIPQELVGHDKIYNKLVDCKDMDPFISKVLDMKGWASCYKDFADYIKEEVVPTEKEKMSMGLAKGPDHELYVSYLDIEIIPVRMEMDKIAQEQYRKTEEALRKMEELSRGCSSSSHSSSMPKKEQGVRFVTDEHLSVLQNIMQGNPLAQSQSEFKGRDERKRGHGGSDDAEDQVETWKEEEGKLPQKRRKKRMASRRDD